MRISNISELALVIFIDHFLKTNPDTLIIINPKASSGKHENDIEYFVIH